MQEDIQEQELVAVVLDGGGANDVDGAGGYSGGSDEHSYNPGVNGKGGSFSNARSGGGGYYAAGEGPFNAEKGMGAVGGMVGAPFTGGGNWYALPAGSGGTGGTGGTVSYSENAVIYAYNGDMITEENFDYDSNTVHEYNKDGTETSNVLKFLIKKNGDKMIPAKIFAQTGICRATYTTNQGTYNLSKVKRVLAPGETLPALATSYATVQAIRATDEKSVTTTGYNNGYMQNQGIGSGAGYLEVSNGSYIVDSNLN